MAWFRGWRGLTLAGALLLVLLQGRTVLLRIGAWPGLGWLARPPEFSAAPLASSSDHLGRRFDVFALQSGSDGVTLWCALAGRDIGALGTPEVRLGVALSGGPAPSGESLSGPGITLAEHGASQWFARVHWPPLLADQAQVMAFARLGNTTWQVTVPVQRSGPAPRTFYLGRRGLVADAALEVEQVVLAADYTAVYYHYLPDPIGRPPVGPFLSAGGSPLARQPQRLSPSGEAVFDPVPPEARSAALSVRLGAGEQRLDVPVARPLPLPVPAWGAVRGGGLLFERRGPQEYAAQLEVILAPGARLSAWELLAGGGRTAPAGVTEDVLPIVAGELHRLHLVFPVGVGSQSLTLRARVTLPPATVSVAFDLP